jgi:hypothetical protein
MREYFKKQIALPQDHGSWVFILSPLLIGIFSGGKFSYATFNLIIAAMSAFMIRQPLTVLAKINSGRRPKTDLPAARFWMLSTAVSCPTLTALILEVCVYLAYQVHRLAWHCGSSSARVETSQHRSHCRGESSPPPPYWIGPKYNPLGWWLWAWTWLQSSASIVYAYLRLEQRELKPEQVKGQERSALWKMGKRAFLYTSFNLAASLLLGWTDIIPRLIFIPFLLQWLEHCRHHHPSIG